MGGGTHEEDPPGHLLASAQGKRRGGGDLRPEGSLPFPSPGCEVRGGGFRSQKSSPLRPPPPNASASADTCWSCKAGMPLGGALERARGAGRGKHGPNLERAPGREGGRLFFALLFRLPEKGPSPPPRLPGRVSGLPARPQSAVQAKNG